MLKILSAAVLALSVTAQDASAAPAAETPAATPPAPPPAPPQCPATTGSYTELNAIGIVLIKQGNINAGEDCLARAIAATVPTYRVLSDIAASRSNWRRAAMISQIGSTIDGTPSSSFFHAKRLLQGGDIKGALEILDSLAAANQDDAAFVHVHGIAQFRNTQHDNAVASLTRAVALSPNDKGYADDLIAVQTAIADADVAAAEAAAASK